MKKFLKPEMEFVEFDTKDVITTSVGDTYNMSTNQYTNTTDDAKETKAYGGLNWNK